MQNVQIPGLPSRFRGARLASAVALAMFGTALCNPVQARIIRFDAPGAVQTYPVAINDAKSITGQYTDSGSSSHAFLRATDGTFTSFDANGATCGTYPHSINRGGTIVGDDAYQSGNHCYSHAFIRTSDGTVTTFDVSGAIATTAAGINNPGVITGSYEDGSNVFHGYVRATNGTIRSFDPSGSINTGPASINKAGVIAGSWQDSSKVWHGFVRATDGTITTIDIPGSTGTELVTVNDSGDIAGSYGYHGNTYGFVQKANGQITTLDPGKSNQVGMVAMNNDDAVTGVVRVRTVEYGFVRAADGTVKKFNPKNSLGIWNIGGINGEGDVTGSLLDVDESTIHGFLRTP